MTVDWDDGSPSETKTLPAGGSVNASHEYMQPGLYDIEIDFPPGTSSDPTQHECVALNEVRKVEVPAPDLPPDRDQDGHPDNDDNCPSVANPGQEDFDEDDIGDACDDDNDRDGVTDSRDKCVGIYNPGQQDSDGDGQGDACDRYTSRDTDRDGEPDATDNCMATRNPGQEDGDEDDIGDACDSTIGDGGDTTLSSRRNRLIFLRVLPLRPIIRTLVAQDSDRNGRISGHWDYIIVEFSESMADSAGEDGAALRLRDADGTEAVITCGAEAECHLEKGLSKGLEGRSWKSRQSMSILVKEDPAVIAPGTIPGLQYPATLVNANDRFKDTQGQALNLRRSDVTLEASTLVF